MCEQGTWTQCIPYTDRLNYASPLHQQRRLRAGRRANCSASTVPERCQYIRVILSEISRIADHLTCLGMAATELGAITVGFYINEARELLYDIIEAVTGARLTVTYGRVGGRDARPAAGHRRPHARGAHEDPRDALGRLREAAGRAIASSSIAWSASALMTPEDAISYGLTGPLLRATGVKLRRAQGRPVPGLRPLRLRRAGRNDGRQLRSLLGARSNEIEQSRCASSSRRSRTLPAGPISIDDPRYVLPEKHEVYDNIEGLMNHFKLIIEGIQGAGRRGLLRRSRAANGELGFYIVSDGSGRPYRVRVRPPCFYGMGALERDAEGLHGRRHHRRPSAWST